MEILSAFLYDKFCLVVIKLKYVVSCPSFEITYIHDCIE